jgi:hypothetical protein
MPIGAAIGGAAVIGAGASIVSGNKAAKAQTQASNASIAEQRREYDQSRADMAPWLNTGSSALSKLAGLYGVTPTGSTAAPTGGTTGAGAYGGFFASPGYQFRLDQGVQAVERSAAAHGLLRSGGAVKAIQRYGEGLASSEYQSFADRLAQMAGVGQNAAQSNAASGANASNNISNALIASGNARASSYANIGSSINSGLSNMMTAYMFSRGGGFGGGGAGGGSGRWGY